MSRRLLLPLFVEEEEGVRLDEGFFRSRWFGRAKEGPFADGDSRPRPSTPSWDALEAFDDIFNPTIGDTAVPTPTEVPVDMRAAIDCFLDGFRTISDTGLSTLMFLAVFFLLMLLANAKASADIEVGKTTLPPPPPAASSDALSDVATLLVDPS